jgi:hypothetical protein
MSSYKPEQRRVGYRGREFHFVSYEAQPAHLGRQVAAVPAMWYLMAAGKRWPVLPYVLAQADEELEGALRHWIDIHVFEEPEGVPARGRGRAHATAAPGAKARR